MAGRVAGPPRYPSPLPVMLAPSLTVITQVAPPPLARAMNASHVSALMMTVRTRAIPCRQEQAFQWLKQPPASIYYTKTL